MEVRDRRGPTRLTHRNSGAQHARAPRETANVMIRDLRLVHSAPAVFLILNIVADRQHLAYGPRSDSAAPRSSVQEPACALHAGACSPSSFPITLPFLGTQRVRTACVLRFLAMGDFSS